MSGEDKGFSTESIVDEAEKETSSPLLPQVDVKTLGVRWESIQTGFVDEPRRSVENADQLVTEAMKGLAASFSEARADLEQQWEQGGDVSTEDLRIILQRYRSFFQRLLAA